MFNWREVPKKPVKSIQSCQVKGHELTVKRLGRSRQFTAAIDGKDLLWLCASMPIAKDKVEKHYQIFYG